MMFQTIDLSAFRSSCLALMWTPPGWFMAPMADGLFVAPTADHFPIDLRDGLHGRRFVLWLLRQITSQLICVMACMADGLFDGSYGRSLPN